MNELTEREHILTLPLKGIYFREIRDGSKPYEYRLCTPYWTKRLVGRTYDGIELTLGYPKREWADCRLYRPWRGYERQTITHPHFGPDPVEVFAIVVNDEFAVSRAALSTEGEGHE